MKSLLNLFIGLLAFLFILTSKHDSASVVEIISKSFKRVAIPTNLDLTNDVIHDTAIVGYRVN